MKTELAVRDVTTEPDPQPETGVGFPAMQAVAFPARSRLGDLEVAAPLGALLERVAHAAERVLGDTLETGVRIQLGRELDATEPARPCFAAVLERADKERFVVALDGRAARMLADKVARSVSGMNGTGELSDAELGLLDFVIVATLDGMDRVLGLADSGCGVLEFASRDEALARLRSLDTVLPGRVTIGGRVGALWVGAPRRLLEQVSLKEGAALPEETWRVLPSVPVQLELAPVPLSAEEHARLAPGSVVLLGASDLISPPIPCQLVTATGWRLCLAQIAMDSPTLLQVRCGPVEPLALPAEAPGRELVPVLGERELTVEQLAAWRQGSPVEFARDVAGAVVLHEGGAPAWRGELVRVQGELGVRLLQRA
ncbi:MAG: FliM/FliN family flagellar motor switch protein [Planctomycetota bacterium]